MPGPLSHIRVLDLSRILAAPWAGQILADLGADVIKVERPGAGDDTRGWGPPFLQDASGAETKEAAYYLAVNRAKRSVTIGLDRPEGQRLVRALAARSDILLENYKVGTLARFGLGYEDLKAVNPRLVYCSVTGFGQTGPRRQQAAYDFMIQAMGGMMSVTGERDDRPGGGPQKVGIPILDLMTGMYATVAVLAALARREVSGAGQYIDIGMLDVQVAALANQAMNYLVSGKVPGRTGNAHPNIQPQDVFACRDGDMVLAVGNDGQFAKLCEVLGLAELARDERFAKNAARVRNLAALLPTIAAKFKEQDRKRWVDALDAAGVPCGPINSIPEVFADPQVEHRRMRIDLPHPLAGTVPLVASPMRFTEAPLAHDRPPPLLGEHTTEILRELGIDDAELDRLRASGVV
ncbi:MAG TPA: CaiB/BaiF CoA-transferase family protein [Burkholderiales bacterium]|nr:CaiB/BaiF CoA-transferase family protein [Burkholderiales bacterium]